MIFCSLQAEARGPLRTLFLLLSRTGDAPEDISQRRPALDGQKHLKHERSTLCEPETAKRAGDAILTTKKHVDGHYPVTMLPGDDIVINSKLCTLQFIDIYKKYGRSTISVEEVPPEKSSSYGMINGTPIADIIEKPGPGHAPSNIGTIGRYIFTSEIFDCLSKTTSGVGNEIQLTDAIASLNRTRKIYAYKFHGTRYNTGDKLGYVKAIIDFDCQTWVIVFCLQS